MVSVLTWFKIEIELQMTPPSRISRYQTLPLPLVQRGAKELRTTEQLYEGILLAK
jgi:hypothetical protein